MSVHYSFDVGHAIEYGVDEAIMIQNFQFWITKNKANNRHYHDGRTWTYNTIEAFTKLLPFWTRRQIERILNSLIEQKVLIKGVHNKTKYDRTSWYAFVDESLFINISPNGEMGNTKKEIGIHRTERPIPDADTDTITKTTTRPPAVVVDEELKLIRETLVSPYDVITDNQISLLIGERGYKYVLLTAEMLAYQIRGGCRFPRNAVAHFIALVRNGMTPPPGFISSTEKARMERIEREQRKKQADTLESIRREDISHEIRKFVSEFCRGGKK